MAKKKEVGKKAEPKKEVNKEALQQKVVEYEVLREEAQKIEKQLDNIQAKRAELEAVSFSIDELKGQKDKDILIPAGSGVFIKGTVTDDKKVLVNVGSNVVVTTSVEEAKRIIMDQVKQLNEMKVGLEMELEKFIHYIQKIAPEIERMAAGE